jgi:hypothetical protein
VRRPLAGTYLEDLRELEGIGTEAATGLNNADRTNSILNGEITVYDA